MTSDQIIALLGPDGEARKHFRDSNGEWVNGFFDQVCAVLAAPHLEELTLSYGALSANVANVKGGVQLNVCWDKDSGWQCHTAPDLPSALDKMWTQLNMVTQLKEEQNVCTE